MSDYLNPLTGTVLSTPDTLQDKLDSAVSRVMGADLRPRTGSTEFHKREPFTVGDLANFGLEASPGIGDMMAIRDMYDYIKSREYGMAGLAGASLIPGVPGMTKGVRDGYIRLYRAESPTVSFEDVFDIEKLKQFGYDTKGLKGKHYTPDYEVADYYRATYGKDAKITYKDVPVSELEGREVMGGFIIDDTK